MDITEAKKIISKFEHERIYTNELANALNLIYSVLPYKPNGYKIKDLFKWAKE